MIDITKQQEKKPFLWKEYATNVLIANIPASTIIAIFEIKSVVPIMILIFGGASVVGKIREKKGRVASSKTVLYALLANIIFFFIIPLLGLALFA